MTEWRLLKQVLQMAEKCKRPMILGTMIWTVKLDITGQCKKCLAIGNSERDCDKLPPGTYNVWGGEQYLRVLNITCN